MSSMTGGVVIVVLSLLAGFGGGFTYEATLGRAQTTTKTASTTASTSTTTAQTLAECLKGVWGDDKYAAISANASLATTQDNLAALKCYKS